MLPPALRPALAATVAGAVLVIPGLAAAAAPSDPLWPDQWGWVDQNAPAAWALTTGSPSVVIAILDTGVDLAQPDLVGGFTSGYDFVDGDDDPSDDNGHGTAVAGIVGARADNGIGIAGWCPRCTIMPVKVVGANGLGALTTIASGLVWAVDHGADVANISITTSLDEPALAAAVAYAEAHDVVVVAAAGNESSTTPQYPAAYPGVVSVAGSDMEGGIYSFSNHGASWVRFAAPGCVSTTLLGGGFIRTACGTSFAAPMVAGIAALARAYAPSASAKRVGAALEAGLARRFAGDVAYGKVDAAAVLRRLAPPPPARPKPRPAR